MYVVIDFETTGLDFDDDEILSVSILRDDGEVLLHELCGTQFMESWPEAAKIHGITPAAVKDKPTFAAYIGRIGKILAEADFVIAYNAEFEREFLCSYGIEVAAEKFYDPMITFAKIYGEWDSYHCDYKWQKLSKCAAYYGYEWTGNGAHDSLEDCRATLFCFKHMEGNPEQLFETLKSVKAEEILKEEGV